MIKNIPQGHINMMKNQTGFTLIELIITVAIIGIIGAVAWPEYKRQQLKSRRTDGVSALMIAAQELQQCHTDAGGYIDKDDVACTYETDSKKGYYVLDTISINTGDFQIRATPTRTDTECATLTLTHLGVKGFTGTGTVNRCWSQ